MPIALLIEILQALVAVASQIPQVAELVSSALAIAQAGSVTPEQEVAIRAQLDQVKSLIDAA